MLNYRPSRRSLSSSACEPEAARVVERRGQRGSEAGLQGARSSCWWGVQPYRTSMEATRRAETSGMSGAEKEGALALWQLAGVEGLSAFGAGLCNVNTSQSASVAHLRYMAMRASSR